MALSRSKLIWSCGITSPNTAPFFFIKKKDGKL